MKRDELLELHDASAALMNAHALAVEAGDKARAKRIRDAGRLVADLICEAARDRRAKAAS